MRLFAAIPASAPARDQVTRLLRELRDLRWPVRWVAEEGIHLTLKFYGEVAVERLDAIAESIGFAIRGTGPLALGLSGLGGFPSMERARVVWAAVEAPPALELLQDRIERHAEALGFPLEGATFRPHITLGRVREGEHLRPEVVARLHATALAGDFTADRVVLYESRLGERGPAYVAMHTFPLIP
ncbi:MAG: RNA 2',3'-cyclic phosphodiesterase [Gemmatimonadales bacterium]